MTWRVLKVCAINFSFIIIFFFFFFCLAEREGENDDVLVVGEVSRRPIEILGEISHQPISSSSPSPSNGSNSGGSIPVSTLDVVIQINNKVALNKWFVSSPKLNARSGR